MTYTPDEPTNAIAQVNSLYHRINTPIVVPCPLALEVIDHLERFGCDRLAEEMKNCAPLVIETHAGLGDK